MWCGFSNPDKCRPLSVIGSNGCVPTSTKPVWTGGRADASGTWNGNSSSQIHLVPRMGWLSAKINEKKLVRGKKNYHKQTMKKYKWNEQVEKYMRRINTIINFLIFLPSTVSNISQNVCRDDISTDFKIRFDCDSQNQEHIFFNTFWFSSVFFFLFFTFFFSFFLFLFFFFYL